MGLIYFYILHLYNDIFCDEFVYFSYCGEIQRWNERILRIKVIEQGRIWMGENIKNDGISEY